MLNVRRAALQLQAAYYIGTGLWPLASRRAFEAVTGPKTDWWLVQMVGLLAATIGVSLSAGAREEPPSAPTRTLALLSALAFAGIDITYALRRRISPIYLADAAPGTRVRGRADHSTVTVFAKFLGWSTSLPSMSAIWYASSCSGMTFTIGESSSSTFGTQNT